MLLSLPYSSNIQSTSAHSDLSISNTYSKMLPEPTIYTACLKQKLERTNYYEKITVVLVTKYKLSKHEFSFLESMARIKANISRVYILEINKNSIDTLGSLPFTQYIDSNEKMAEPLLMDTMITTRTNYAYKILTQADINITGKGVKIGMIDTGIDWRHPFFYYDDGDEFMIINETHVERLSDGLLFKYYFIDTVNATKATYGAPSGDEVNLIPDGVFNFGYEYLFIDLDGDLQPDVNPDNPSKVEFGVLKDLDNNNIPSAGDIIVRLNTPKIKRVLDERSTPYKVYISGINLSQLDPVDTTGYGHGTHVAGIILGGHTLMKIHGVAVDAELYAVINGGYFTYENVIFGMEWLSQQNVCVINMSFGGTKGYLDGSDPWDLAIDDLTEQGILSVVSAGNLADNDQHVMVTIPAYEAVNLPFNVHYLSLFINLLWRSPWADLRVKLISPYNVEYDLGSFSNPLSITETGINIATESSVSPRYTNQFLISIYSLSPSNASLWTLRIENPTGKPQTLHGYIMWSIYNTWSSEFLDINYTINSPSTADTAISVAASTKNGHLAPYSSRGPRVDGLNKPELTAPGGYFTYGYDNPYILSADGDTVLAGQPPYTFGHANYEYMYGTSMAAPHVTGFAALLKQKNPNLNALKICELLFMSCELTHFLPYTVFHMPSEDEGYGKFGYSYISLLQANGALGPGTIYVTAWYPTGYLIGMDDWLSLPSAIYVDGDDRDWLLYYPVIINEDYQWYEESAFELYSWHANDTCIFFYIKFRVNYALPNHMITVYFGRDRPGFISGVDYYLPEWRLSYDSSLGTVSLDKWNASSNSYTAMPAGNYFGAAAGFSSIDGKWLVEFYVRKTDVNFTDYNDAILYFAVYGPNFVVLLNNNDYYNRKGASFHASIDQTPILCCSNIEYSATQTGISVSINVKANDYWSNIDKAILRVMTPSNNAISMSLSHNETDDSWFGGYIISPTNQSIGEFTHIVELYDDVGGLTTLNLVPVAEQSLVDDENPMLTLNVPEIVSGVTIINWTVNEPNLVELILYIDHQAYDVFGTTSLQWDTENYNDGNHTIRLYAEDSAGLAAEVTRTVIVDNTAPQISWISPENNTLSSNSSVTVKWAAEELTGIAELNITLDNNPPIALQATQTEYVFTNLLDGWHMIKITAKDLAGNTKTSSTLIVGVDTTKPQLQIIAPINNSVIYNDTIILKWEASDNMGIASISIIINNRELYPELPPTISQINITGLDLGEYSILVKAYDKAGNIAKSRINISIARKFELVTFQFLVGIGIGILVGVAVGIIISKKKR